MLIRDLLEARRREQRGGKGSKSSTIEMASDNDSIEIDVEYFYNVEPGESEGGYTYAEGGIDLEDTEIQPFTFEGKHYKEITPEVVGFLEFPPNFLKDSNNKALVARAQDEDKKHPLTKEETKKLVDRFLDYVFENYESDDIHVPTKNYPMTR